MYIGANLQKLVEQNPEKAAIMYKGKTITYQAFNQLVQQLQNHLLKLAPCKGQSKVAILIGNEPSFLALFFAVARLGWIAIPFDPKWSKREAIEVRRKADPDIILTNQAFMERAVYTFPHMYDVDTFIGMPTDFVAYKPSINSKAPFYIGFTSGSTGIPKGYIRSHQSWIKSFTAAEETFQYGKGNTIIAPGPLCHSLSLFGAVHALHIGATFQLFPTFGVEAIDQLLQVQSRVVMYAVPTMLASLAKGSNIPNDKQILFLSSGATLHPQVRKQIQQTYPLSVIYEYYGASELSFVAYTKVTEKKAMNKSVGKAFPGVTITIRNEEGDVVPTGIIGHIYIDSDYLFSGYVDNEPETARVLTTYGANIDDLGFIDEDGELTIIGREKNMIITGGLNVYPEEVEKVIKELDVVQEAVVIGIEDSYWGQKLIALIEWKNTSAEDDLIAHCYAQLASYKVPKSFHHMDAFPYTSSGKVDRKKVQQHMAGLNV